MADNKEFANQSFTDEEKDTSCKTVADEEFAKQSFTEEEKDTSCKDYEMVWAKLKGHSWWPAISIKSTDCNHPPIKHGNILIFWFGTYEISEISRHKLRNFFLCFNDLTKMGRTNKCRDRAIMEALQLIQENAICPMSKIGDIMEWAQNGFGHLSSKDIIFSSLPGFVARHLQCHFGDESSEESNKSDDDKSKIDDDDALASPIILKNCKVVLQNDALVPDKLLKSCKIILPKLCVSCRNPDAPVLLEHPLFKGGLCSKCKDVIKGTIFCIGPDDKNICCIICGQKNDMLIMCKGVKCPRVYCNNCIWSFFCRDSIMEDLKAAPWLCFFCLPRPKNTFLEIQTDWEENIISLFDSFHIPNDVNLIGFTRNKPIRVLSLFDGISTGKVVLDALGIVVEKYFAAEIDKDAINVSTLNHKDSIVQIGDVCKIVDSTIGSLGHIDLVIGGSPCNDLSIANPKRKGLYAITGTGQLFFDFFHILHLVWSRNPSVLYLYENVASMEAKDRVVISSFFSHDPAVIDAKYFSPQNRKRYFWGNIPGLHSLSECWSSLPSYRLNDFTLNQYLLEHFNRTAMVDKIRTVTTSKHSLIQDQKELRPVSVDGTTDVVWITELEKIFGFPVHYTDTGNISNTKRHRLLGNAWSVPVVQTILQPLKFFFKCE